MNFESLKSRLEIHYELGKFDQLTDDLVDKGFMKCYQWRSMKDNNAQDKLTSFIIRHPKVFNYVRLTLPSYNGY